VINLPPIWLLDVDGVLNVRRSAWHSAPHNGRAYDNGREWKIRWAPQLITRIRTLHKAGKVEVRWCTTWCSQADQLERLFKLPVLERAFTEELRDFACSEAKLAAARAVLASGRRLIWTDDVEVPVPRQEPELYAELTAGGRALLIRPDERDGLRPEHMDEIEAFVRGELTETAA
jgi:HAD domain in Swiss Army Knife RNA repair proteins